MRPILRLLCCVVVISSLNHICPGAMNHGPQTPADIGRVELDGKRLIVTGINFGPGAVIRINQHDVETKQRADSGTELIAKKGGKRIPVGETSLITIRNADGELSRPFYIFRTEDFIATEVIAAITPLANINFHAAYLSLKPGDYFVVNTVGINNISLVQTGDPGMILDLLTQPPFDNVFRYLYRVRRPGGAQLQFAQDLGPAGGGEGPVPFVLYLSIDVQQ